MCESCNEALFAPRSYGPPPGMESLEERRARAAREAEERERKLREIEAMRGRRVRIRRIQRDCLYFFKTTGQLWKYSRHLLHEDCRDLRDCA